ncbi:hypothetical protein, partial [Thiolapillus sp.]|uniref:hypothetical protein n=1 Tax=Thiolapillus sp. TaxID=2017437 RepID=UPI0025CCEBA1
PFSFWPVWCGRDVLQIFFTAAVHCGSDQAISKFPILVLLQESGQINVVQVPVHAAPIDGGS